MPTVICGHKPWYHGHYCELPAGHQGHHECNRVTLIKWQHPRYKDCAWGFWYSEDLTRMRWRNWRWHWSDSNG